MAACKAHARLPRRHGPVNMCALHWRRTKMAKRTLMVLCLGICMLASAGEPAPASTAGHITGVGGVFFKAKDPKAQAAWYRDVLGMPMEAWGGAKLRYDAPQHPPALIWSTF